QNSRRLPGPPGADRGRSENQGRTGMILVEHRKLNDIGRRVFTAAGSVEEEAAIIADHLVEANLRGHDSHGVGLIATYLRNLENGKVVANENGRIVRDSGAFI